MKALQGYLTTIQECIDDKRYVHVVLLILIPLVILSTLVSIITSILGFIFGLLFPLGFFVILILYLLAD